MLLDHPDFMFRTNILLVSRDCNNDCLILFATFCKFTRFRDLESSTVHCGGVHELCLSSANGFQDQDLSRQGENLKFATVIGCLDLCRTDSYGCLYLELMVCEMDFKMVMNLGGFQVIAFLEDGSFVGFHATEISLWCHQHLSLVKKTTVCCFEALTKIVGEGLLQFHCCVEAHMRQMEWSSLACELLLQFHSCAEAHMRLMKQRSPIVAVSKQFHSYVSAHMRQVERKSPFIVAMEVKMLSCLIKRNSLISIWLALHVRIGSQSCVSRQGETWPELATLIHEADCVSQPSVLCVDHILVQPCVLSFSQILVQPCVLSFNQFLVQPGVLSSDSAVQIYMLLALSQQGGVQEGTGWVSKSKMEYFHLEGEY